MAKIVLKGDASGSIDITVPAAAGSNVATFPAVTGTVLVSASPLSFPTTSGSSGDVLTTDGSGNLSWTSAGSGSVTSVACTLAGITVTNPSTTPSIGGVLLPAAGGTGITALGVGVAAALGNPAGGVNGFATIGVGGFIPTSQGGTGLTALGTGVQAALGNATNGANGLAVLNGSGVLPFANGGTGLSALGTAGQVLTVNGGATAAIWASPAAAPLTVGTTQIASGTTGSLLIQTGTALQEIVMGTGVAAALALNTGAAGGLILAGASPVTQHGVVIGDASGALNSTSVGTAGQILTSGGAGVDPSWTTATYPATTTINQLLYSSAADTVTELATANGGILNTSNAGVPSITATPTLGVPGTTAGSLAFAGATSGTVTIDAPAVAGTNTATFPARTGTVTLEGPVFRATLSADQNVSALTYTKVNFDTIVYDTDSCFSTGTSRFTPTVAGYYQINGETQYTVTTTPASTAINVFFMVYKNGTAFQTLLWQVVNPTGGTPSSGVSGTVSTIVYMNGTTDYLEFYVRPGASGTGVVDSGTASFSGSFIRGQ